MIVKPYKNGVQLRDDHGFVVARIPDHGAACKVYRISPFEAWRVERTRRRKGSAEASRFPSTELVPGGFITSACSPLVYLADLFPKEFLGNTFMCDPANNLIHRDKLVPKGATYTADQFLERTYTNALLVMPLPVQLPLL